MTVLRIIYIVVSLDMQIKLIDHHLFHDVVNGISGPGLSEAALPQNTQPGYQATGLKVLVLFLSSSSRFTLDFGTAVRFFISNCSCLGG